MFNFLSVGGSKYGVELFTQGSNGKIVSVEEALENKEIPLCWAGSHKETLRDHCYKFNLDFFNLDTGYFGNKKTKDVVRLTKNNFQDNFPIVSRSDDRLKKFDIKFHNYKRGSTIVIVPPDEKIIHSFNLPENYTEELVNKIKSITDRPLKIRNRPMARDDRVVKDKFIDFIKEDTWVVVGYSSNSLVESILCGIPVISLGHSATKSLCDYDISYIDSISNIDLDKRYDWAKHLSYRQFTKEELSNGTAWNLINS